VILAQTKQGDSWAKQPVMLHSLGGMSMSTFEPALPTQREQLLGWACAQAAANHSVSDCAACDWWTPPALAPAQPRPLPPASASPELAWFICLTAPTDDERTSAHLDFARAAIVSARLNAPSLAPHVIFLQTPDSRPGGPQSASARFLAWLRRASVRVVPHNLSFFDLIPPSKQRKPGGGGTGHLNVGAYCRLDVPQIVEALAPELAARGVERERVLYTDTDVLFAADFELARATRAAPLPTFAAGSEVFSAAMNSGVMLINATALRTPHTLELTPTLRLQQPTGPALPRAASSAAHSAPRARTPPPSLPPSLPPRTPTYACTPHACTREQQAPSCRRCCATPPSARSASSRSTRRGRGAWQEFHRLPPRTGCWPGSPPWHRTAREARSRLRGAPCPLMHGYISRGSRHAHAHSAFLPSRRWLAEWFAPAATLAAKGKPPRAATPGWRALDDDLYNARAFHHPARRKRRGIAAASMVDAEGTAGAVGVAGAAGAASLAGATGSAGAAGAAGAVAEPRVWHWHGYKPHDVACWLRAMESGAWPARGWRDTKSPCRRGRCRWKPIHGSGCRYFGRIEMGRCYLRTYTYLLTQHLRMLAIAESLDT